MISIIIPLYNKEKNILNTIASITAQSYNDYEIIVVDDGSTDNSMSLVENLNDKRIKIFKKQNGGPASARNCGVRLASGDWLLFLDADDTLEPGALNLAAQNIRKHPFIDVFTYNLYVEKNGEKTIRNYEHTKGYCPFPFTNWYLNQIYPRTGNMVIKRSAMLKEPYREDFRRYEDAENTIRLMRHYRFYACQEPLFSYNQDTLEACFKRDNVNEDFICTMTPQGKSFFEQMMMYHFYHEACWLYPEYAPEFYGKTFAKMKYGRGDKYLKKWKELKDLIRHRIR